MNTPLKTLPNNQSGTRLFMEHTLDLPVCCPVSRNPRPHSTITICYRASEQVLEIASLVAYLSSFVGGKKNQDGEIEVRDMEGMIQRIADDCAQALGVYVKIVSSLELLPRQHMRLLARGYPLSPV